MIVKFLSVALTIGLAVACIKTAGTSPASPETKQKPTPKPMAQLAGSEWGFEGQSAPYIQFGAKGEMNGNGGCNRFGGSYELNGQRLIIGPIMSTKKACIGPKMAEERAFFQALRNSHHIEATHRTLVIYDENSEELLSLVRRDWD